MNNSTKIFAIAALLFSGAASAQNLVINGGFEQLTTNDGTAVTALDNYIVKRAPAGATDTTGYNLTGWTNTSFLGVVFGNGISDSGSHDALHQPGYSGAQRQLNWVLRGPQNKAALPPANYGLTAGSPSGGNFFGADSNYFTGALTQTVAGLTIGQSYTLSYWWAAGTIYTGGQGAGSASAGWNATFANGTTNDLNQSVSVTYDALGTFIPWAQVSYTFKASATSELLTMTPTGTGSPPMALLDGVSIVAVVPEPGQWALLAGGLGLILLLRMRSRCRSH